MFICKQCNDEFKPKRTGQVRSFCGSACFAMFQEQAKQHKMNNCLTCNKKTSNAKFCSKSCSAIKANSNKNRKRGPQPRPKPERYPTSTVFFNTCAKTGRLFTSNKYQKFHPTIIADREHYANLCKFNFALSDFPGWFNTDLIRKYGMYSTPGSRSGIKNINGVSRDHMISVNDGWVSNIDPKIISHPANCMLIRHKENQIKNRNSSLTLEQLLKRIELFDQTYNRVKLAPVPGTAPSSSVLETDTSL